MLGFALIGAPRLSQFHTACQLVSPTRRVLRTPFASFTACAKTSRDEVKRIANLARLELTDDEITNLTPEFGKVIEFFSVMNELDLESVEPMSTPNDLRNITREDNPVRFTNV